MERQIILGTEGTQPFKIECSGVSRTHARIIVHADGTMVLEDLNSTNGTYVRDGNGDLRQISSVAITPMTFICLGPNNANGCTFYALQALAEQDGFAKEFEYLNEIEDRFDADDEKADNRAKMVRTVIAAVSLIALIGSFMTPKGSELQLLLLRFGSFVSLLSSTLYNPADSKKKIAAKREKYHHCPNPKCTHILSSKGIRMMQCSRCKAQ